MGRNDVVLAPPPPSFMAVQQNTLPQQELASNGGGTPASDSDSMSPSIIITFLVIATAVIVSATIYLLLRCISVYRRRSSSSSIGQFETDATTSDAFHHRHGSVGRVVPENNSLIESLPLFSFASIIGAKAAGGDCSVCLSKFEPHDRLRLLPVCCHVFHAECIDTWLATNQTCPLCRSSIFVSETELMNKIASAETAPNSNSRSGSFRIEIGSVSRRRPSTDFTAADRRRSYSIGSFDYIVDDLVAEVTVASNRRESDFATAVSGGGDKSRMQPEIVVSEPPGEALAAEVSAGGGRGSWLKDYVDRLTWTAPFSLSSSLRSSGRFFTGSSRRTDESRAHESDLEASRLGDEIGEMFRWLSGV